MTTAVYDKRSKGAMALGQSESIKRLTEWECLFSGHLLRLPLAYSMKEKRARDKKTRAKAAQNTIQSLNQESCQTGNENTP